jgi:hypothetical protein
MYHAPERKTATREEALQHEEICTFLKKENFYVRDDIENYHTKDCPDILRVHNKVHGGDTKATNDRKAKTHEGHEWLVGTPARKKPPEICHTEGCHFQEPEEQKEKSVQWADDERKQKAADKTRHDTSGRKEHKTVQKKTRREYTALWGDLPWQKRLDSMPKFFKKDKQKEIEEEKTWEARCREAREREVLRRSQYRPLSYTHPQDMLPRGLQILAEETDNLREGFKFPYPRALANCDISLSDWERIGGEIIGKFEPCGGGRFHYPQMSNFEINTVAKNIESVLDNVAELDVTFFRPRGLIMRMDMPGEQKFGLDDMDLYFGSSSLVENHPIHSMRGFGGETADSRYCQNWPWNICAECIRSPKYFYCVLSGKSYPLTRSNRCHLAAVRRRFFEGTRIVIESLTVLQDSEKAHKHGWIHWIQQCKDAKATKLRQDDKPIPVLNDTKALKEYIVALEAYFEPMLERPISERVFRWPPSKQIYYDRWRGHTDVTNMRVKVRLGKYLPRWITWEDSMDKRMDTQWTPKCVVPADEIEVIVMERECVPKDQCLPKRHSPKMIGSRARPWECTRDERRFPPLLSEIEAALDRMRPALYSSNSAPDLLHEPDMPCKSDKAAYDEYWKSKVDRWTRENQRLKELGLVKEPPPAPEASSSGRSGRADGTHSQSFYHRG